MSKELYESQVAKEAAKRFRMLCEYSFVTEEGEGEDMPDDPSANGVSGDTASPSEDPSMNGTPDAGMDPMANGDPSANGGAPGFNPQEGMGDPSMNGDPANNETPDAGMDPMANGDPSMTEEPSMDSMQPGDEVIDIDELTNSQEETEGKVDDLSMSMEQGFEKLFKVVSRLDKMIDDNTANMEQIKQEIEKRNPTALEKLNMRAANNSYPFNVSPNAYWKEKEATSNYRIGGEDEDDAKQYTITQGDIDSITDFNRIAQELNASASSQNLLNVFGIR